MTGSGRGARERLRGSDKAGVSVREQSMGFQKWCSPPVTKPWKNWAMPTTTSVCGML